MTVYLFVCKKFDDTKLFAFVTSVFVIFFSPLRTSFSQNFPVTCIIFNFSVATVGRSIEKSQRQRSTSISFAVSVVFFRMKFALVANYELMKML